MKTYTANFTTSGGAHLIDPIRDTNKTRIGKTIRRIAESSLRYGEGYHYEIWEEDGIRPEVEGGKTTGGRYWKI